LLHGLEKFRCQVRRGGLDLAQLVLATRRLASVLREKGSSERKASRLSPAARNRKRLYNVLRERPAIGTERAAGRDISGSYLRTPAFHAASGRCNGASLRCRRALIHARADRTASAIASSGEVASTEGSRSARSLGCPGTCGGNTSIAATTPQLSGSVRVVTTTLKRSYQLSVVNGLRCHVGTKKPIRPPVNAETIITRQ
jgi:hypothetical protein